MAKSYIASWNIYIKTLWKSKCKKILTAIANNFYFIPVTPCQSFPTLKMFFRPSKSKSALTFLLHFPLLEKSDSFINHECFGNHQFQFIQSLFWTNILISLSDECRNSQVRKEFLLNHAVKTISSNLFTRYSETNIYKI